MRTGKDGKKRISMREDEWQEHILKIATHAAKCGVTEIINGNNQKNNHRNGLLAKILIPVTAFLLITLVGAAWAGITQIPALKARQANTDEAIGCLRYDVNKLISTNAGLKARIEIFLNGQGR